MLQQIAWIFEKELRYALRDTDVLIYSVLVPLLIYPGILLAASEVFLWQMSEAQHNFRVCIKDPKHMTAHLYKALTSVEGVKLTPSEDPKHDLDRGKLDAYITFYDAGDSYNFVTYVASKKGALAANKLGQALVTAQKSTQEAAYKEYKVPASDLEVCTVNETRFVPFTPTHAKVESQAPLGLLAALLLGVLQIGLTAGVTGVCVFAEEKEKKTFETTLSLPISSSVLTAGKWLASMTLSLFSGITNIIAVGAACGVVLMQAQSVQKLNGSVFIRFLFASDGWSYVLAIMILILSAALSTAICLLFVSGCKTFKDGQAFVTYPMLVIISIPILAFVPGIEQLPIMYWVPLTNLFLCLKHPQGNLINLILAIAETLAIIAFSLFFAGKVFFSEKNTFSSSSIGSAATQSPQKQKDSV